MDTLVKLLEKLFDQLMLTGQEALPHMVKAYQASQAAALGLSVIGLSVGLVCMFSGFTKVGNSTKTTSLFLKL